MVGHVARYLADPSLDREGRRQVVADQCQFTDGKSSERVAEFVVDELADVIGGPERVAPHAGRAFQGRQSA